MDRIKRSIDYTYSVHLDMNVLLFSCLLMILVHRRVLAILPLVVPQILS